MSREVTIPNEKALLKLLEQFELYAKNLQNQPLSAHTKRAYETRLQHFLGFLGTHLDKYSDALTNETARDQVANDYKQYLKQQIKSSPQTINAYLTAIDSFFFFLGLGRANASRESLPDFAPQTLSASEQQAFVSAISRVKRPRDRALANLLLYTGIRIYECEQLSVNDVVLTENKGHLTIREQSSGSFRRIPLNSACRNSVRDWLKERHSKNPDLVDGAFFISNRGTRLSVDTIDYAIRKIAESAKLASVSSSTLRHTFLANLLQQSTDIHFVSKVGGHKKLETTLKYAVLRN